MADDCSGRKGQELKVGQVARDGTRTIGINPWLDGPIDLASGVVVTSCDIAGDGFVSLATLRGVRSNGLSPSSSSRGRMGWKDERTLSLLGTPFQSKSSFRRTLGRCASTKLDAEDKS